MFDLHQKQPMFWHCLHGWYNQWNIWLFYLLHIFLPLVKRRQDEVSNTARNIAFCRWIGHTHGKLCTDPYAYIFMNAIEKRVIRHSLELWKRTKVCVLWKLPYVQITIARTLFIDQYIQKHAHSYDNLVILGAGLDTRAHRILFPTNIRVYELDRKSILDDKRKRLPPNSNVVYVPINFETDDVMDCLRLHGFHPKRTMIVWEGVVMYLHPNAIRKTFRAFRPCLSTRWIVEHVSYVPYFVRLLGKTLNEPLNGIMSNDQLHRNMRESTRCDTLSTITIEEICKHHDLPFRGTSHDHITTSS